MWATTSLGFPLMVMILKGCYCGSLIFSFHNEHFSKVSYLVSSLYIFIISLFWKVYISTYGTRNLPMVNLSASLLDYAVALLGSLFLQLPHPKGDTERLIMWKTSHTVRRWYTFQKRDIMNIYKDDTKYEALLKCSLWNKNIKDPQWHPFKIITIKGQPS